MEVLSEKITALLGLADQALRAAAEDNVELFVEKTDAYMTQLEAWQASLGEGGLSEKTSQLSDAEKAGLRELVTRLNEVHAALIKRAENAKQSVGTAMTDLHRRASGLRKYVDTYPSRITIAGKRQG